MKAGKSVCSECGDRKTGIHYQLALLESATRHVSEIYKAISWEVGLFCDSVELLTANNEKQGNHVPPKEESGTTEDKAKLSDVDLKSGIRLRRKTNRPLLGGGAHQKKS